jgi:hypothetical protein
MKDTLALRKMLPTNGQGHPKKNFFEKPKPKPAGVYRGFQALFIHFIPEKLILSRLLSKTS